MTLTQINIHSAEYRIRPASQRERLIAAARTLREAAALAKYDGSLVEGAKMLERARRLEATAGQ